MAQTTFDGTILEVKQPQAKLAPTEKKILLCVKYNPGKTHWQIRDLMKGAKNSRGQPIGVFDNKLRHMRKLGFVESHQDEAIDELLWYIKEGVKIGEVC